MIQADDSGQHMGVPPPGPQYTLTTKTLFAHNYSNLQSAFKILVIRQRQPKHALNNLKLCSICAADNQRFTAENARKSHFQHFSLLKTDTVDKLLKLME